MAEIPKIYSYAELVSTVCTQARRKLYLTGHKHAGKLTLVTRCMEIFKNQQAISLPNGRLMFYIDTVIADSTKR